MAENPARPVTLSLIAENIGIATISKPPVNPLSSDVCDRAPCVLGRIRESQGPGRDHSRRSEHEDLVSRSRCPRDTARRPRRRALDHGIRTGSPTRPVLPDAGDRHASQQRLGAACDLAVTCDLAIGTPKTTFAITPVKIGVSYNTEGMSHFLGVLPLHVVKEMVFTGDPLSAEDAYRFGLLNRLVEPEKLEETTMTIARTIASRAPLAVAVVKAELAQPHGGFPDERSRVRVDPICAASRISERRPQRGRQGVF